MNHEVALKVEKARLLALHRAMDFLVERVKDAVGVGRPFWIKRTPTGRPPYLRTGQLRASIRKVQIGNNVVIVTDASSGGFRYGEYLEGTLKGSYKAQGRHPFIAPTAYAYREEVKRLFDYAFAEELNRLL